MYCPLPTIHDDLETLRTRLRQTRDAEQKQRLYLLVLIGEGGVKSRREAADYLAVHRNSIGRWLACYEREGLEGLLRVEAGGAPTEQRTLSTAAFAGSVHVKAFREAMFMARLHSEISHILYLYIVCRPHRHSSGPMSNKENTFGIFEEVWKTVREHFFDPNFNGVDWNALRWVYAPKIKQAVSKNVAFSITNQMLAELKCSHTRLYNQSESAYYELVDIFGPQQLKEEITRKVPDQQFEYRPMGFYTKELNGETFISGILAGSPAANAGLMVGEKVVAVNGNSFFEPAVLAAQMNEAVKLCIERNRDPGVTMNVTLVPQPLDPGSFFLNAIRESIELIPRGDLRIGYIRVWSFAGDQYYRLLTDALTCGDLKDADGLVMDLRGGWGGADPSYLNIFTERTLTFTQVPRYGPAVSVAFQWSKPVVMLVDEETRSGKEILAYGFKAYRIGKVIGTRTAGAVLMGKPFSLQDGSLLFLAVADVLVNGERLEGKSVVPDIEVPRRLAYAEGRDNQLDTAIEALIAELHRNCSVSPTPSSVPANHRTTAH